jgi:hypothetical protein
MSYTCGYWGGVAYEDYSVVDARAKRTFKPQITFNFPGLVLDAVLNQQLYVLNWAPQQYDTLGKALPLMIKSVKFFDHTPSVIPLVNGDTGQSTPMTIDLNQYNTCMSQNLKQK